MALRDFSIGKKPNIGGDACVVEELLRERNQGFQQIVFKNITTYLALTAARVPGEKGRAIHDNGDARAALLRLFGAGEHVQQEKELTVADARQTGA